MSAPSRTILSLSGGAGSWAAGRKWRDENPSMPLELLFTDTLCEDQDTYRFLVAGAANLLGVTLPAGFLPKIEDFPAWEDRAAYKAYVLALASRAMRLMPGLHWLSNGEDVWDVFERRRMLGSTRVDPCSEILKRNASAYWLRDSCDAADTLVLVGLGPDEPERFEGAVAYGRAGLRARKAKEGWTYAAPLMAAPVWWPPRIEAEVERANLWVQRLYRLGFVHANCGGACCKAGIGQWRLMLQVFPERYAYAERREAEIRDLLKFRQTMLRDRRGGETRPLSLADLRQRTVDLFEPDDGSGCGCFLGDTP